MYLKKKNHYKYYNTKIQYANKLILEMPLGDPTTCVYQFFFDENDSNYTNIIKYFIIHGLGL